MKRTAVGALEPPPGDKVSRVASGLSEGILREALEAGWVESLKCTGNDPPNYAGLTIYAVATRRLRELTGPLGWRADNGDNYCTTVSQDGQVRVLVAAGDACTGTSAVPCTRNTRGPRTRVAVQENVQLVLFEGYAQKAPRLDKTLVGGGSCSTWMLLHYVDEGASETRVEFSLPVGMDDGGRVEGWHQRIVLRPIPHQLRVEFDGEGEGGDVNINVEWGVGPRS